MKICTHCNNVYPTHKLSCKKTNPEYRLPTADEFFYLKYLERYENVKPGEVYPTPPNPEELIKDVIEFAKLHVENQRSQICHQMDLALENSQEAQEIVNTSYPLENIK